jgi:hypothetical protein
LHDDTGALRHIDRYGRASFQAFDVHQLAAGQNAVS